MRNTPTAAELQQYARDHEDATELGTGPGILTDIATGITNMIFGEAKGAKDPYDPYNHAAPELGSRNEFG